MKHIMTIPLIKFINKVVFFTFIVLIIALMFVCADVKSNEANAALSGGVNPGSGYQGQYGYTIDGTEMNYTLTDLSTRFWFTYDKMNVDLSNDTRLGGYHSGPNQNSNYDGWWKGVTIIELKDEMANMPLNLTWTVTATRTNTGRNPLESDMTKMNISSSNTPYNNHNDSSDIQVLGDGQTPGPWDLSVSHEYVRKYIRLVIYINGHYQLSQTASNFRLSFSPWLGEDWQVPDVPSSGGYRSGGNTVQPTATTAGDIPLTIGCRTRDNPPSARWSTYMSDGANNDLRYNGNKFFDDGITRNNGGTPDNELLIDQGTHVQNRSQFHYTTIPLSQEITNAIAAGYIDMTFSLDAGTNKQSDNLTVAFISWGSGGQSSFTRVQTSQSNRINGREYYWANLSATISGARAGVTSVRVGLYHIRANRNDYEGETYGKNMKLNITSNAPDMYNVGYFNYGTSPNLVENHLIPTNTTKVQDGKEIRGLSLMGISSDTHQYYYTEAISVSSNTQYSFSCLYWSSDGYRDQLYVRFNAGAYGEGQHQQVTLPQAQVSNIIDIDLGGGWWKRAGTITTRPETTSITGLRFDSDAVGREVFIAQVKIELGSTANFNGLINVTNINHSSGSGIINTSASLLASNTWCRPMNNSHTTGSGLALYYPTGPNINSLLGELPFNTNVKPTVITPSYNDGIHTPSAVVSATPSISPVMVTALTIPIAIANAIDAITTVPTDRSSYTALSVNTATSATSGAQLLLSAFAAKQPADAYRWRNPLTLPGGSVLDQDAECHYQNFSGTQLRIWSFKSSGTMRFSIFRHLNFEYRIYFDNGPDDWHILLAPGVTIDWWNNRHTKEARFEITGTGKVFIYLMGNNTIDLNFGDYVGGGAQGTPQLYFIGIGGNNTLNFHRIDTRIGIYMPHGQSAPQYPGINTVKFSSNIQGHQMWGTVVADHIQFTRTDNASYTFYKSGLPNTLNFLGENKEINYFLEAPATTNANYNWNVIGTK